MAETVSSVANCFHRSLTLRIRVMFFSVIFNYLFSLLTSASYYFGQVRMYMLLMGPSILLSFYWVGIENTKCRIFTLLEALTLGL